MDLDHVDVVARGIQQDVAPVIGNRPGVRPPVDEAGTEVEVWLQQVVLADVNVLMGEVLAHRMGGKRQSPARADSFTRWLFGQQRPAAAGAGVLRVPEVEADGEAIFIAYGCATCHDGPALGGQKTETIAGVAKQVPTLRRISLHPPFMHDGRSPTLEAAIRDMVETTRNTTASEAEVEAMAAYLRAL